MGVSLYSKKSDKIIAYKFRIAHLFENELPDKNCALFDFKLDLFSRKYILLYIFFINRLVQTHLYTSTSRSLCNKLDFKGCNL